ncbi:hypothetical protein [Streptomyces sp. NPDC060001]|uniref:hypothetical protein n=1 Tax=Streptomyces sp. NPDC060001 TaxID=3347032 RepID=UPI003678893D
MDHAAEERRSAREILTTTLTHLFAASRRGRMDSHRAEAERLVEEALKEHSHELAEEIRAWVADDPSGDSRASEYGSSEPALNAADLIDPTGIDDRCVGCGSPLGDGQAHGYGSEFGGCV